MIWTGLTFVVLGHHDGRFLHLPGLFGFFPSSSPTPASWAATEGRSVDGFEMQFATNHLGHFVLAIRIASLLKPGGRLVMVSSAGRRGADVDLDDPGFEHSPYDPLVAYRRSKTATLLFAVEIDRRLSTC